MMLFSAAVLLTMCMNFGVILRYVTFAPIVSPEQKRTLFFVYGVLAVVNLVILTAALHIYGLNAAFMYLRFGGIVYAAVLTLVNILVIRGKTQEHLFVAGVVLTCNYLLMSVPNYAITFLQQPDVQANLFMVLTVYVAVLLLAYWPLRSLLRYSVTPFLGNDSKGYWKTIWFIPIAFFGTKFLDLGGEHNAGGITQLIGSTLYIVVIVMICLSIASGQRRMNEQRAMEKQLAGQKRHYEELKTRVEAARKNNHDFKHQIAAIRHYMQIDDKEGLCSFCDGLAARHSSEEQIPYTGNVAADGVLYHFLQLARKENVELHYSGVIRSNGIADLDMCTLLGNALDNALTACRTVPDGRSIQLVSQSEPRLLSIMIRNTFDGKVEQDKDGIRSRKGENRKGVGIASMQSVCESYGGSMDMQWDEKTFTVMFLLPLKEE